MPLFKNAQSYARTMTGLTAAFTIGVLPFAIHQGIDEGLMGADHTTLSETAAQQDRAYIEKQIQALQEKTDKVEVLTAKQGMLYRESRDNKNDAYTQNKKDIGTAKAEAVKIKQDIFDNIYTNRSLSEQALENIMYDYRINFNIDVPGRGKIQEDFAREIRDCQIEENMDVGFIEPTELNAEQVESCASLNVKYEDGFPAGFPASIVGFISIMIFGMFGSDIFRGYQNQYYRRKDRKALQKPQKRN